MRFFCRVKDVADIYWSSQLRGLVDDRYVRRSHKWTSLSPCWECVWWAGLWVRRRYLGCLPHVQPAVKSARTACTLCYLLHACAFEQLLHSEKHMTYNSTFHATRSIFSLISCHSHLQFCLRHIKKHILKMICSFIRTLVSWFFCWGTMKLAEACTSSFFVIIEFNLKTNRWIKWMLKMW